MKPNLSLEPIGNCYRIVRIDYDRPVIFESDLPIEIMEQIYRAFESRLNEAYEEGWGDGYGEGWDDCLVTEADK